MELSRAGNLDTPERDDYGYLVRCERSTLSSHHSLYPRSLYSSYSMRCMIYPKT